MSEQIIYAALMHFQAVKARAEANLEIYLQSSVGVGEHKDLVEEVIQLTKIITEADEAIQYLEKQQ
jgi:hypothetical protein|tara:strand:+ start:524 stop:721 length:198 start_codon:yes stop_codon:yes gene_type:complete